MFPILVVELYSDKILAVLLGIELATSGLPILVRFSASVP
jgi:hypothetical protein